MTEFGTMKIAFERVEKDLIVTQWRNRSASLELVAPDSMIEF